MSKEMRDLLDQLKSARAQAKTLQSKAEVTPEELNAQLAEINKINAKIETQKMLDDGKTFNDSGIEVESSVITKTKGTQDDVDDKYSSMEYRKAFRDYCVSGKMSPLIMSADAQTTTGDATAVIPSTILNEVIKRIRNYGQIFAGVRKLSIKGGVQVPILTLKPTASWISETTPSDKQKTTANTSVSFSYYGLECKISVSLLADTVTLAGFETVITDIIAEAIAKALDLAIISGTGTGQPLGVTVDTRIPAAQVITLLTGEFTSWSSWKKKVFAKMPLAYKAGANMYMASGTYEGYIDGMVDSTGQPIARTNYGITEGPQERFGGKPVIQVEDDIIANYDDAATGTVVAIFMNPSNYAFNSNMQLMMYRYLDNDKNQWVDKAILIADGKVLDPNGVVIVKKGAAS